MLYVGIDPGASGALTAYDGKFHAKVFPFKDKTPQDIYNIFNEVVCMDVSIHASIEKVKGIPADSPRTAFKFGENYGLLLGFLIAFKIPYDRVAPQTWQKTMGIAYPPGTITSKKEKMHKIRAEEILPGVQTTQKAAASVLIAIYTFKKEVQR